jgi:ATP-dependent DNA helicase RecG
VERLKIMMETSDGFRIAEKDLALRGPGELLGVRQSGFLNFRVADLLLHGSLLLEARDEALAILRTDPELRDPAHAAIGRVLGAAETASWVPGG